MRSRVAILSVLAFALAFASGCSAESAKIPSLKPPATYSSEESEQYGIGGHLRCEAGDYDGNAIPVDPHTGEGAGDGLSIRVEKIGADMVISVSYEDGAGVAAFIAGDAPNTANEQWFNPVLVPTERQHDSRFRLSAKEVSLGTANSLTALSVCPVQPTS